MKNKVLEAAGFLYGLLVVNKQKAIMAFVAGAVAPYLLQHGFSLDMTLGEALESFTSGLIMAGAVYLKRNR